MPTRSPSSITCTGRRDDAQGRRAAGPGPERDDAFEITRYEVKTGTGRQMLYTAIGQLATHAEMAQTTYTRYSSRSPMKVFPKISAKLSVKVDVELRLFRLKGTGRQKTVELD
jgi:hypothetical protein